ncbi:methyltransferase domain protein [Prevotella amnii]|uniref:Methyltransferase domain protein n=2 Tax=Prevotella amnii TaxID=419005 RepID=A0A134BBQ0_9BACT|nr:methyltransferase domain protein [Prevotella amnii]
MELYLLFDGLTRPSRLFNHLTDTSMQARHLDRKRYFEDSAITSAHYYLPYIKNFHPLNAYSRILEIGCGEGGNLKPFAKAGYQVFGVDMAKIRIEQARQFFSKENLECRFESSDFMKYPAPSDDDKFDVVILHDVIEHVPDKLAFVSHIRKFMNKDGILFVAFPAWQMPFGGHQQICRNNVWSKIPFFHLLPHSLYRFILRKVAKEEDATIKELLYIKQCRCPIEKFEKVIKAVDLSIQSRVLWFINPHYHQKFGLSPQKLCLPISHIPILRNFFTTSCFYLLKLK